jgi:hypothetical protein
VLRIIRLLDVSSHPLLDSPYSPEIPCSCVGTWCGESNWLSHRGTGDKTGNYLLVVFRKAGLHFTVENIV